MDNAILHDRLPNAPWLDPAAWRLPGVQPLAPKDWLIRDEVFAAQMALRDQLIAGRRGEVLALLPKARPAAEECLDVVLAALSDDPVYRIEEGVAKRPDDIAIPIDRNRPLMTIGRLQQADVCLMEAGPDGHVLTGAVLCFPARWTLAEKLGKPLSRIHAPVAEYDGEIDKRVQRLFEAMRPDQVLWRANAVLHETPALFTPLREDDPRAKPERANFVRSERQTLRRLPRTGAVVFTIHTRMIALDQLTKQQIAGLHAASLKVSC